jgi:hypothetical protein
MAAAMQTICALMAISALATGQSCTNKDCTKDYTSLIQAKSVIQHGINRSGDADNSAIGEVSGTSKSLLWKREQRLDLSLMHAYGMAEIRQSSGHYYLEVSFTKSSVGPAAPLLFRQYDDDYVGQEMNFPSIDEAVRVLNIEAGETEQQSENPSINAILKTGYAVAVAGVGEAARMYLFYASQKSQGVDEMSTVLANNSASELSSSFNAVCDSLEIAFKEALSMQWSNAMKNKKRKKKGFEWDESEIEDVTGHGEVIGLPNLRLFHSDVGGEPTDYLYNPHGREGQVANSIQEALNIMQQIAEYRDPDYGTPVLVSMEHAVVFGIDGRDLMLVARVPGRAHVLTGREHGKALNPIFTNGMMTGLKKTSRKAVAIRGGLRENRRQDRREMMRELSWSESHVMELTHDDFPTSHIVESDGSRFWGSDYQDQVLLPLLTGANKENGVRGWISELNGRLTHAGQVDNNIGYQDQQCIVVEANGRLILIPATWANSPATDTFGNTAPPKVTAKAEKVLQKLAQIITETQQQKYKVRI